MRVELHGRRVRGWVVALDVDAPPGVELKPIAKVTGWGPPADVIALADAFGIARFGVIGNSAGVPYALACAALIPERLPASP